MNFFRQILIGLMIFGLVFVSVGCNSGGDDDDDTVAATDDDDDTSPSDVTDTATDDDDDVSADTGVIRGRVETEETNLATEKLSALAVIGVANATVEILQGGVVVASTTTDADGYWEIADIPEGSYTARAYLIVGDEAFSFTSDSIVVSGGNEYDIGSMTLAMTGAISGNVILGGTGDYSGVTVYLPGTSFVAMTNTAGEFTILYIPPGTYNLTAEKTGYSSVTLTAIEINAGEETTISDTIGLIPIDADCMDGDGDGYGVGAGCLGTDCNDALDSVYFGANEIPYNEIDEDCNGSDLTDVDGDGFTPLEAATGSRDDCDDNNADANPDGTEVTGNEVDEDCSGAANDVDGDGEDSVANGGTDCDDNDASISIELVAYLDVDGDGFGYGEPFTFCTDGNLPSEYADNKYDCDDTNLSIYPTSFEVEWIRDDANCNGPLGIADTCFVYTFDATGLLLSYKIDDGCRNNYTDCEIYSYDEYGNVVTASADSWCDETINSCREYTYDAEGNQLMESFDNLCDTSIDNCTAFTYDANGNLLSSSYDTDCDGAPYTSCKEYTYDASGNKLTYSFDSACDGEPDSCTLYDYDASGNLVSQSGDDDCNGIPDHSCWQYTYDTFGNKITSTYDSGCDSNVDNITCHDYVFDSSGNILFTSDDRNCDSTPDYCMQYTYVGICE